MLYTRVFGFNVDLIKAALVIGCYDIFGTIMLIILEIEFFSQSTFFTLINFCGICRACFMLPLPLNWNQLTEAVVFLVETEQLIYLSCFSIGIIAAILLIHGAFQVDFLPRMIAGKFLTKLTFAAQPVSSHLLAGSGGMADCHAAAVAARNFLSAHPWQLPVRAVVHIFRSFRFRWASAATHFLQKQCSVYF